MGKKILSVFFAVAIIYWIIFVLVGGYKQNSLGLYTQIPLIVIPGVGGILGLMRFRDWGGFESAMGKAVFWLSLGMVVWGLAIGIWTYYLFLGIALPYPSTADYVFVLSSVFHIFGFLQLSKVVGAPFGFRKFKDKFIGLFAGIAIALISYYILVVVARGNILRHPGESTPQVFFNYAYTIASLIDVTIVAVAYILSYKYLGGIYKKSILILLVGFVIHFFAVFFFVKTISDASYFNGNIADILFTIAVFLESFGIVSLDVNEYKR